MNRIDKVFKQAKQKKKTLFIAYVMAGDPHLDATESLIPELENSGVDLIELGVPFSDPIADGVVIQEASERAIDAGTTLEKVLGSVQKIRKITQIPIVLFSYLNPISQYGIEKFSRDAVEAGVDGLLILDLPPEESAQSMKVFKKAGLKTIFLIAPTTPEERIEKIAKSASGFLYYVSRLGVTGIQDTIAGNVEEKLKKIRAHSSLPVAVGFGISKPEHVLELSKSCDAVVVGSAIVKKIAESNETSRIDQVTQFVHSLTSELK